jgi:hypothetical protein
MSPSSLGLGRTRHIEARERQIRSNPGRKFSPDNYSNILLTYPVVKIRAVERFDPTLYSTLLFVSDLQFITSRGLELLPHSQNWLSLLLSFVSPRLATDTQTCRYQLRPARLTSAASTTIIRQSMATVGQFRAVFEQRSSC